MHDAFTSHFAAWSLTKPPVLIGIDIGGSKLLAHLCDAGGRTLRTLRRPTGRYVGPEALIHLIGEVSETLLNNQPLGGIGLGFPGLVDAASGMVRSSVILDGWLDVPLAKMVAATIGVPCAVDNDVKNAARAEAAVRGPVEGAQFFFVSVGTGIGGALVLDGRVWTGVSGLAGEIGHVVVASDGPDCLCGRKGCVGARASGGAIAARLGLPAESLNSMIDDDAAELWSEIEDSAREIGVAIGSLLNLLNLPLIVVGGGLAELGDRFVDAIRQSVANEAFPEITTVCRIERASAGYEAGAIGAALLAREALVYNSSKSP